MRFLLQVFSWIVFSQANENDIRVIPNFSKICGDIRKSRCTPSINDTGGKFFHRSRKFPPVSMMQFICAPYHWRWKEMRPEPEKDPRVHNCWTVSYSRCQFSPHCHWRSCNIFIKEWYVLRSTRIHWRTEQFAPYRYFKSNRVLIVLFQAEKEIWFLTQKLHVYM